MAKHGWIQPAIPYMRMEVISLNLVIPIIGTVKTAEIRYM